MIPGLEQLVRRFASYAWYEVALEMLVIFLCIYLVLRFLRGTRGAGVIKGFLFLLIALTFTFSVLGNWADAFARLDFIYNRFLGLVAILLIVVFQPELRRAMTRLGETRLFRPSRREVLPVVEAVSEAVGFLSKSQFGALIAIERTTGLEAIAAGGVALNADVSARLLQSIFWPNSPLHDLGVVISGEKILAASVQFPLIDDDTLAPDLGSRHRAALGLSAESDCLVMIVSEETGAISLAEGGRLERRIELADLPALLLDRLRAAQPSGDDTAAKETDEAATPSTAIANVPQEAA